MKAICLLIILVVSSAGYSQDERFYRKMFYGNENHFIENFNHKISVKSPRYALDLNRDGIEDFFQTVKKDGVDFIRIMDHFGKIVFERSLMTKGNRSRIFKAKLKKISNNVDALILYFYDGHNQAVNFEGSARLYIITIPGRNFSKITLTKGPYFWTEREKASGTYWNRRYSVNIIDYNKDGVREISVNYNKSAKILFYADNGLWKTF